MKRRNFITLLGGGTAGCVLGAYAWSFGASAQPTQRVRRIGVLMGLAADDPESQARLAAFAQGPQQAGWTVGQNIRIDYRWGAGNADVMRKHARGAGRQFSRRHPGSFQRGRCAPAAGEPDHPIVFTLVADPVGAGYVSNLARPGGNVTGFTNVNIDRREWLRLLKEIAPNVKRVAVLRESFVASGPGQFGAIQTASHSLGVEVRPLDLRDAGEIERDITAFARDSDGGLIVTGSPAATVHRNLIYALALRHRLPVVYNSRFYVSSGGLISYGPDFVDQFRRAAAYVDQILKGQSPATLPVQAPVKYELAVNLKIAKALGMVISPAVLSRADDVIE